MQPRPCVLLPLLALISLTGCHSSSSARRAQPQRYTETSGHYMDFAARDAYISERIKELTATGMSEQTARTRASREWFARAPVAESRPTAYELSRRKAQAELDKFLVTYTAERKAQR